MPDTQLRKEVRQAIAGGLQHVQKRRAKLEAEKERLQARLEEIDKAIRALDVDLSAAIRESFRELKIAPPAPRGRRAASAGRMTIPQWLGQILQKRSLSSEEIYEAARNAGLPRQGVATTLNRLTKSGKLKAKSAGRGRSQVYSKP